MPPRHHIDRRRGRDAVEDVGIEDVGIEDVDDASGTVAFDSWHWLLGLVLVERVEGCISSRGGRSAHNISKAEVGRQSSVSSLNSRNAVATGLTSTVMER